MCACWGKIQNVEVVTATKGEGKPFNGEAKMLYIAGLDVMVHYISFIQFILIFSLSFFQSILFIYLFLVYAYFYHCLPVTHFLS